MKAMLIGIAFITPILSGCISDSSASQVENVDYSLVSSGVAIGISNPQFQIIKSDSQFSALVSVATLSGTMPTLDFSTRELIAIFLGENVGCGTDSLSISNVTSNNSTVTVHASRKTNTPIGACNLAPLNGFSYVFISIPKDTKPVSLSYE